ncbi:MAG: cupin domain-containing protein [Proteobacteria bacterium]|nr:cupin domain-containing protein [Pseudomonadota bacterium]
MSDIFIKNVQYSEALTLGDLVEYQDGQVVSRTLAQPKGFNLTLFALAAGEGISTHSTPGDALVQILDGEAEITIGGFTHTVGAGQSIVMPANVPHGLEARQRFKMFLTVVKMAA